MADDRIFGADNVLDQIIGAGGLNMAGENSVVVHHRTKDDRRQPWIVQLLRPDGSVVNLTNTLVKYRQITLPGGAEKVAATDTVVTVTDESNGKLTVDFPVAAVDTEGTFAMFILVSSDFKAETFPVDGRKRILKVEDPNTEALP